MEKNISVAIKRARERRAIVEKCRSSGDKTKMYLS
jgi:hypothetical protein